MAPVVESRLRVRYGETDNMGVVYYANYLTYFEVGRTDYCRAMGIPYSEWEAAGVYMPVVEVRCRYKHSARYDDELLVRTSVSALTPYSMSFSYSIFKIPEERLLVHGYTRHGFCDSRGRLIREPQPFYGMLLELCEDSRLKGDVADPSLRRA
ncbi:MAG TPA: acyl-CoA thioesterase [Synergistaceae bacterium]|jgi:acyl-CoA thioester hydrolase|nr:acyl-CoA thioesterase [Synergistaceae bacterium]